MLPITFPLNPGNLLPHLEEDLGWNLADAMDHKFGGEMHLNTKGGGDVTLREGNQLEDF